MARIISIFLLVSLAFILSGCPTGVGYHHDDQRMGTGQGHMMSDPHNAPGRAY